MHSGLPYPRHGNAFLKRNIMLIKKLLNYFLDLLIFVLLFLLAPLIAALVTIEGPIYTKIVGVFFMLFIIGAVVYAILQNRRKIIRKES